MPQHRVGAQTESLPVQPTAFIGREDEIARAMDMLADSHCRLLTLTGEGGIGKTRLALEIAARSHGYYSDGIAFVDLQAVGNTDTLLQVIADAVECSLSGQPSALAQLLQFLREKDMLLLLDNFEQLLPEGAEGLISELLNGCPGLTILVTSREVLNLRQEWVWRTSGLAFPPEETTDAPEAFDAVKLFTERARHVRSDFLLENDLPYVLQICRLVEGMPLALELAACWLKVLPCKAIAQEIRQNLDFLNSHQRDLPERHRSVRAVFEQCWKLLSDSERETINRLSIFKGGFRRDAAEQVAGARLNTLMQLTDKSLLRLEPNGRFHIHELVRQYAAERLGDAEALLAAHGAYFARFMFQREDDLRGGRQIGAIDEIGEELDNVRAAWDHAVKHGNAHALIQMTTSLALFCQFRSRYQESYQAYMSATASIKNLAPGDEVVMVTGMLYSLAGWIEIRMGKLEDAEESFRVSQAAFDRLGIIPSLGYGSDPSLGRAVAALVRGDHHEAVRLAEYARASAEKVSNISCWSIACRTLAEAHLSRGEYEAAQLHASKALQLCIDVNDIWFMAYCHTTLGEIALKTQSHMAAKRHFEQAYQLRQQMRDPEGMGLALAFIGDIALEQQALDEALRCYDESRALYQQINDPGGLSRALCGLSRTQLLLGDIPAAAETCRKALEIAVSIQYVPVLLQLMIVAGELCFAAQDQTRGLEILVLVMNHAAANLTARTAIEQFLAKHKLTQLPPVPLGYDLQDTDSLIRMAAELDWALLEIVEARSMRVHSTSAPMRVTGQLLLDPLSPREIEVLSYMAAGLQNREIADRLVVSLNTVKTHINNIYSKLGVTNRVQAVTQGRISGLL